MINFFEGKISNNHIFNYKALDKLSFIHVLNLVFSGPIFLYWYYLCTRKARSFHNIEMYSWTLLKWPCFRVRGKTEKLFSLGKLKYSGVNFINILLGQFAPIFWRQKLQSWSITGESCAKHFSTKKCTLMLMKLTTGNTQSTYGIYILIIMHEYSV